MSFLALGGDGAARPTFFELIAAERLMPSLKAATLYSLSVLAQRRHYLHRLLRFEDEALALLTLALDRQALANGSATFADGLYGLRRAPFQPQAPGGKQRHLDRRQQRLALLCQVLLPYLHAKLHKLYERHAPAASAASPPLLREAQPEAPAGSPAQAWPRWLRRAALAALLRGWPWAHAAAEGAKFCYQLLYLLDASAFYSPVLHLLGQHIVRVSGQELLQTERQKRRRRAAQLHRAGRGLWPLAWLRRALLTAGHAFADHSRNALILLVFAFKLLEWWYTSAEQALAAQKALPVPPPPPPAAPHPRGAPLPPDPADCPLCRRRRTNPALLVASGYAFCYPCLHAHVSRDGRCPVTLLPATPDAIRRLYHSQ